MHFAGVDTCQLRQALDESIETIGFFIDDFEHFLAAFRVELRHAFVTFDRIKVRQ